MCGGSRKQLQNIIYRWEYLIDMQLAELIKGLNIKASSGDLDLDIDSVVYDSRKARAGSLFVCVRGFVTDGHQYIRQALDQNVSAIMIQDPVPDLPVPWVRVDNSRRGLAHVSDRFFDHPSGKLKLLGITGTKGKTTATYMTRAILKAEGQRTGLIGTVANIIGDSVRFASRTTPESYDLQALLDEMTASQLDSCVMEVSSQGLMLDRVYGCEYAVGAFTNLYEDHIGPHEHPSMEAYLAAKLLLFDRCHQAAVNRDLDCYETVRAAVKSPCLTFGLSDNADIRASKIRKRTLNGRIGSEFELMTPWGETTVFVGLPGQFNIYNALTAITCAGLTGVSTESFRRGLADITVPGRLQPVPGNSDFQVLVDYAHNAASLEHVLQTLREYTANRLIVVFGCGGDRSRTRRFEMGRIAGELADLALITSDNPRSEDPDQIIADIITGIKPTGGRYLVERDRAHAIEKIIQEAQTGDMILIAGKGHETYQIFKDQTIHFDDAEVAERCLNPSDREDAHGTS